MACSVLGSFIKLSHLYPTFLQSSGRSTQILACIFLLATLEQGIKSVFSSYPHNHCLHTITYTPSIGFIMSCLSHACFSSCFKVDKISLIGINITQSYVPDAGCGNKCNNFIPSFKMSNSENKQYHGKVKALRFMELCSKIPVMLLP